MQRAVVAPSPRDGFPRSVVLWHVHQCQKVLDELWSIRFREKGQRHMLEEICQN